MEIITQNRLEIFIKTLIKNNVIGIENAITHKELYKICYPEYINNNIEYGNKEYLNKSFKGNMRFNIERCFDDENRTVKNPLGIIGKTTKDGKAAIFLKKDYLTILQTRDFIL